MFGRSVCLHLLSNCVLAKTKQIFSQGGVGGVLMGGTLAIICLQ